MFPRDVRIESYDPELAKAIATGVIAQYVLSSR
jgi:hypothetical protein